MAVCAAELPSVSHQCRSAIASSRSGFISIDDDCIVVSERPEKSLTFRPLNAMTMPGSVSVRFAARSPHIVHDTVSADMSTSVSSRLISSLPALDVNALTLPKSLTTAHTSTMALGSLLSRSLMATNL
jgi:hypothetical protein